MVLSLTPNSTATFAYDMLSPASFRDWCYVRIRLDPDVPRGKCEKSNPVDSYRLSSPERVLGDTRTRTEETKTARAEPEFLSVPRNLREIRSETSNISSKVVEYKYMEYIY